VWSPRNSTRVKPRFHVRRLPRLNIRLELRAVSRPQSTVAESGRVLHASASTSAPQQHSSSTRCNLHLACNFFGSLRLLDFGNRYSREWPRLNDTTLDLTVLNSVICNDKKQVKQVTISKHEKRRYYHMAKPNEFLFAITF